MAARSTRGIRSEGREGPEALPGELPGEEAERGAGAQAGGGRRADRARGRRWPRDLRVASDRKVAKDPKRYQVSFLEKKPSAELVRKLEEAAAPTERVVADGREIYAWHPEGVARSKLWAMLAGKGLGVTATARNWTTVTKLLELADA